MDKYKFIVTSLIYFIVKFLDIILKSKNGYNMFKNIKSFLSFLGIYFKGILLLIIIIFIIISIFPDNNTRLYNLVEIKLSSEIKDVSKLIESIDEIKKDASIKGVLFNINSPGGSVSASIEISQAIKELNKIKPVIVYASGTLASGSYYASIYATEIIVNPGSIVGSIGVIMQTFNINTLMNKIGIKPQIMKKGEYKETGTMFREWTKIEKEELQELIDDNYQTFIKDVSEARNIDIKFANKFANAHIFSAQKAKRLKLVDEIATMTFAKNRVILLSKVKNPIWKKKSSVDKFIDKLSQAIYLRINSFSSTYLESKIIF